MNNLFIKYSNQAEPMRLPNVNVKKKVEIEDAFQNIEEILKNNTTIKVLCTKCLRDGTVIADLKRGIKGYIPREEVSYVIEKDGLVHKNKCSSLVGSIVEVKVKEIENSDNEKLIKLSRKDVVLEYKNRYMEELKPNMVVKGTVIGIQKFGAYVDIGGDVTGMIPVADISKVFIKSPDEVLSIGQEVEVLIKSIKKDNDTIYPLLSRKELYDVWDNIFDYYNVGETVSGRVKNMIDTGIFVELDECIEGLAEFEKGRVFEYGDPVTVKIEGINKARRKIKLRII